MNVIRWGSPVPSFGDLSSSLIATLGLNPSNREFVDVDGTELEGPNRRFHTLRSLHLRDWSDIRDHHLDMIAESCRHYFLRNPYTWFSPLNEIISGTSASYYGGRIGACHLDLIPYATACKWTALTSYQRRILLEFAGDTLGLLLRSSPIRVIVLNGKTVIDNFERITGVHLEREEMSDWTLPRKSGRGVKGVAFSGNINAIAGVKLARRITALGFNHNIQSSYGVTNQVKESISAWISNSARGCLP